MDLVKRMKECLPFEVQFKRDALMELQKKKKDIRDGQRFSVVDICDSGDIGGIVCVIPIKGETLVVSLTHLSVDKNHPLADEIETYQYMRTMQVRMLDENDMLNAKKSPG